MLLSHKRSSNSLTGLKALPGSHSNLFPSSLNHSCQNWEFFHTSNHLHGISTHNITSCNIISLHLFLIPCLYIREWNEPVRLHWGLTLSCCSALSQPFTRVTSSTNSMARSKVWPGWNNSPLDYFKTSPYMLVSTLIFWHLLPSQFSVRLLQNVLIWYHSSVLKIKTQCKIVSISLLESYYFNSFYFCQPSP